MMRGRLWNKKGFTLVEMVVTFALLSLFCVAVVFVIGSSLSVFRNASAHARAQTVSQTILSKVVGEIGGAQPGASQEHCVTVSDGTGEGGFAAGACIDLCTRTGSPVYITATSDGYLLIHYRPLSVSDGGRDLLAVDWMFDEAVYNGFTITALSFQIEESNVLSVELTLTDSVSGYTYTAKRYIQCYNYNDPVEINNICPGPVIPEPPGT